MKTAPSGQATLSLFGLTIKTPASYVDTPAFRMAVSVVGAFLIVVVVSVGLHFLPQSTPDNFASVSAPTQATIEHVAFQPSQAVSIELRRGYIGRE